MVFTTQAPALLILRLRSPSLIVTRRLSSVRATVPTLSGDFWPGYRNRPRIPDPDRHRLKRLLDMDRGLGRNSRSADPARANYSGVAGLAALHEARARGEVFAEPVVTVLSSTGLKEMPARYFLRFGHDHHGRRTRRPSCPSARGGRANHTFRLSRDASNPPAAGSARVCFAANNLSDHRRLCAGGYFRKLRLRDC